MMTCMLGAGYSRAQPGADSSGADPKLYNVVTTIMPGRPIRLGLYREEEFTGHFVSNTADSLTLDLDAGTRALPLSAVNRLWVRGKSTGPGFLIGAAVGSVSLAVLGAASANEGSGADAGSTFVFGLMGAAMGGFVGSMVGLAIPRWRMSYESPD